MPTVDSQLAPVLRHLERNAPGDIVGAYLFGSAVSSGLRPDSDVDLLVLTRRSMATAERLVLVDVLLGLSGWKGHAARFPDAVDRRPIELTSLVLHEVRPWTAAPRRDFQYGEWLREQLSEDHIPESEVDPDVLVLAETARAAHEVILGPPLGKLLDPVPPEMLREAMIATIPDILGEIEGDERNTLLVLARILVTLETGRIVSKDVAANAIIPSLSEPDRVLMELARDGYLGLEEDCWEGSTAATVALVHGLARRALDGSAK